MQLLFRYRMCECYIYKIRLLMYAMLYYNSNIGLKLSLNMSNKNNDISNINLITNQYQHTHQYKDMYYQLRFWI